MGGRRPFATVARTKRLRRGWCRRVAGVDAVHVKSFLPVVAAVVVLGVLQWALGSSDYFVYLASLVGVNVVLAVSLNIINGMTGQFSIGHAGFMAVGAYVSGTTSLLLKDQQLSFLGPLASDQLFLLVSLLIGGVSAGVFGFLVGLPSLRLRGDYLAIDRKSTRLNSSHRL